MSSGKRYSGKYERIENEIEREILYFEFDTVLKQAGEMKPWDVDDYPESIWENLKPGE